MCGQQGSGELRNSGCGEAPAGDLVEITGDAQGSVETATAVPPGGTAEVEIVLSALECGSYNITGTVDPQNEICECDGENNENSLSFDVPCPECRIDPPEEVCVDTPMELAAVVSGGQESYGYRWSGDGTFEPERGQTNGPVPVVWAPPPGLAGQNEVRLEVIDGGGCETDCGETISVVPCEKGCCLNMTNGGEVGLGLDLLPVDVPLRFDTANSLFAAFELAKFAAEASDR